MAVDTTKVTATPYTATAPQRVGSRRIDQPSHLAWLRFMVFGRAVPATLFGVMGWLQLGRSISAMQWFGSHATALNFATRVLPGLLYTLFCSIPVAIYLSRPMPTARDGRLVARAAAFTGTTMQLFVGALLPTGPLLFHMPGAIAALSGPLSIAAFSFALYSMGYLRRSLSIIPEARRLVTGGPYRLVRHPLYLAEITAAVSLVISWPAAAPTLACAGFVVMQMLRARFEERLLGGAFSEYEEYSRRTRRLVPFVW